MRVIIKYSFRTYIGVRRVLVDWAVKIYVFFIRDHAVAKVGERNFVHDIDHKSFNRYMHILRQMHLIELV